MSVSLLRGCSAVFAVAITATGASADVTAQDVWDDWKSYLSGTGYTVTGTENSAGGTLTVSDVTLSMAMPEDEGNVSISMADMAFAENGDGTVNVSFPAEFPINVNARIEDGEAVDVSLKYAHDGTTMVVSGTPDDMVSTYASGHTTVTLDSLTVDGETLTGDVARFAMTLEDVAGTTRMIKGDQRSYVQDMTSALLTYDLEFEDPSSDDRGKFAGSMQNLSFEGTSVVPLNMTAGDMAQMLRDGFAFDGGFRYASGSAKMNGTDGGESFDIETSSSGGTFDVAMNDQRLSYDVLQTGAAVLISVPDLPFPLNLSMAEAGFKIEMPVSKSDQEQPFALAIRLGDFSLPDEVWGLFDPAAILPRDPASIVVDLTGRAKVLFDLMDPESMTAVEQGATVPGELNAVTVNQLLVSAAGSKLTGTGDFTFDNTDLASYDGMPAPMGVANLSLLGANGLLDKLIQMGVMSDSDAMGARMMMGMLAVPGETPDSLNSTIEFAPGGQILANGQRIK